MKRLTLVLALALSFVSCEKDESNLTEQDTLGQKVLGTWEMYRDENLVSTLDEWTGTEWTTIDQWFQNTREDSDIILEFNSDNTFKNLYATVEVANGTWGLTNDGRVFFDYIQNDIVNENLLGRRYLSLHCDNTYSIEVEGNDRAVYYYRKIGTTECSELINYNVD
ncbi:hypothetical protein FBALC1_05653 [Flavobacteriales bacterium ALC-1]|nr:hypothetical protein FBALC1_05653 [Flavobacteriales bacterium ALC-1]